jgi:hypothetical protein
MNAGRAVVSNAGPLMALAKLNVLHLLQGEMCKFRVANS